MVRRMSIDLNNLKVIDEEKIPDTKRKRTPFRKMLKSIPKGKALVLTAEDVNLGTAASAVRNLKKNDAEFKDYIATRRTVNGVVTLYIINPGE